MKFIKLTIENYKSFQYPTEIAFPITADGRSIFLIGGMNGAGKTSIMEAINYCLYGAKVDEIYRNINRREKAKGNAKLNGVRPRFVQADIFPWLRDAGNNGERFDVVILDPAKMTRDREQVINALKKYLDMNKLALGVVKPGGLFATFSCTGLVSEEQFTDMLRRAAFYAGRTVQVLKVAGAGPDHPWLAQVPESRYLKAVFCRVVD